MTSKKAESIFQWDTLKEIGTHDLWYDPPVAGKILQVDLTSGQTITAWRANDGQQYFCHGLTFGGKEAFGGPISPFTGKSVETILQEYYQIIPEDQSLPGDILVWKGIDPESTPHSAVLTQPILTPGKNQLEETTLLQSKNGTKPEATLSLANLFKIYGESYNVYRRREGEPI